MKHWPGYQFRTGNCTGRSIGVHPTGRHPSPWKTRNINHSLEGKWVALSGGILVHLNSDLGLHPYFFPGLDIRLKLPGSVRLFSSLNHSMRLPTFTDLYYQGPDNVGNPDLLPEKATTFELGIYGKSTKMQVSINGFYRQGRELIEL